MHFFFSKRARSQVFRNLMDIQEGMENYYLEHKALLWEHPDFCVCAQCFSLQH